MRQNSGSNADKKLAVAGLAAVSCRSDRRAEADCQMRRVVEAFSELLQLRKFRDRSFNGFRVAEFVNGDTGRDGVVSSTDVDSDFAASAGWIYPRGKAAASPLSKDWIACLYRKDPGSFADTLNGQYCAVVVDASAKTMQAVGDCGGLFPWYVFESDGLAWVSTSAMPLAAAMKLTMNKSAARTILLGAPIRSPDSLFQGVRRMAFGEQAELTDGALSIKSYWSPFKQSTHYHDCLEAAKYGLERLGGSCRQVHSDFPNAVWDLTSGLDTRLAVAAMSTQTASLATTVNGTEGNIDVRGATEIADCMGWELVHTDRPDDWGRQRCDYFEQAVHVMDGEIGGHLCDAPLRVKRVLSERFDASATGGGGELFREFPWEHLIRNCGTSSEVNVDHYLSFRLPTQRPSNPELFARDFTFDHHAEKKNRINEIVNMEPDAPNTAKLDAVYLWRSSGHFGRYSGGFNQIVPSPTPLMTRDLLDFCLSVPARFRFSAGLIREMTSLANPQLAKIWTCWGGSAEPMGWHHPIRSVPYWNATAKRWIRRIGLRTIGAGIFSDPFASAPQPHFDQEFVSEMVRREWLSLDDFHTASLYRPDGLRSFLASVQNGDFRDFTMLYRMMTLERACRACGTSTNDRI